MNGGNFRGSIGVELIAGESDMTFNCFFLSCVGANFCTNSSSSSLSSRFVLRLSSLLRSRVISLIPFGVFDDLLQWFDDRFELFLESDFLLYFTYFNVLHFLRMDVFSDLFSCSIILLFILTFEDHSTIWRNRLNPRLYLPFRNKLSFVRNLICVANIRDTMRKNFRTTYRC